MSLVVVHPAWLANRPANDIAYHFQLRGFDLIVGKRWLTVEPKPRFDPESVNKERRRG